MATQAYADNYRVARTREISVTRQWMCSTSRRSEPTFSSFGAAVAVADWLSLLLLATKRHGRLSFAHKSQTEFTSMEFSTGVGEVDTSTVDGDSCCGCNDTSLVAVLAGVVVIVYCCCCCGGDSPPI
jgi:hypothetical protein